MAKLIYSHENVLVPSDIDKLKSHIEATGQIDKDNNCNKSIPLINCHKIFFIGQN